MNKSIINDINRGFSLIELLVVISIIVILSAIGMANYRGMSDRGKDTRRKGDLAQIQGALELYRMDAGDYPNSLPDCGESLSYDTNIYMKEIPCDPGSDDPYIYSYSSNDYSLTATLSTGDSYTVTAP